MTNITNGKLNKKLNKGTSDKTIVNEYFSGERSFKDKLLNLMIKKVKNEGNR